LEASPADIVRWLLVQFGFGVDPEDNQPPQAGAWPIFATNQPNFPDQSITVLDTRGQTDGREMTAGALYDHFGFQVAVRTVDHAAGWQKLAAIRSFMSTMLNNVTVGVPDLPGTGSGQFCVYTFAKIGQVLASGKEAPNSRRSLFTLNALVAIHSSPY
jgi:hypothetical protein